MLSQAFCTRLREGIARMRDTGNPFTYWWRDDDAKRATAPLARLLRLSEGSRTPLVLAVIPGGADASLAQCIEAKGHVYAWQHGFSHTNHAPVGGKKTELGSHRPAEAVLRDLSAGREQLSVLLGESFATVLVPPWNRLADDVIQRLPESGLTGLSTFGIGALNGLARGVPCANSHVDIIDWRGTRGFVGEAVVLSQLLTHIDARIAGTARALEATGLLTHHLVHDEASWQFLEALTAWLREEVDAYAVGPEQLFVPT